MTIYKTITVMNKDYMIGFRKAEFDYEAYIVDAAGKPVQIKFSIGNSMVEDMRTVANSDYRDVVVEFLENLMKRSVADG